MAKATPETEEKTDIVTHARTLYKRDEKHWGQVYDKAREDLYFLSDEDGAQWDAAGYQSRIQSGRPALTIDQLGQFIHQVANDIRQNTPSINVIPTADADEETADVVKGLIRSIEYRSNADDAYDTAALNAIKCSIGFIRVDHGYVDDKGFDQELRICRVVNSLACYIDSNSIECDGKDAMHGFALEPMLVSQFKKRWPGRDPISFTEGKTRNVKKDTDYITVAEFFEIEETAQDIEQDGAKRTTTKRVVKRYWLSGEEGSEPLESTTFPGKYIPIIPVYGEEAWREGERHVYSLIRKSKQSQQMFNLWKSLETELLMKQPQAPIMAAEGQVEEYADEWKNPNKSMVLRYKTVDGNGNEIPPPQRLQPPTVPTGFVNASRETVDDIKATMGIYNASLGAKSNETSGVAIQQRQREGDVATYHFADNLTRSITQVGRVIVSAIPEIYDTKRTIRIIGEEEDSKPIGINGIYAPKQERSFDLTNLNYDVRVTTGASYTTKRQEAAAFMTDVVSKQPELFQVMGDLLFKNMDVAGAEALSNRMRKLIPPNLLEGEDGQEAPAPDPEKMQMAQTLQEQQMQLQQAQMELADKTAETQNKQADTQLKAQQMQIDDQEAKRNAILEVEKLKLEREKLEFERDKLAHEAMVTRIQAKSTMTPEIAMTDGDLHEGAPPIMQMFDQLAQAMMMQSQTLAQGLQQIANAQAESAQMTVQSNAMLAQAISAPKSVVYGPDGMIQGVR